MTAVEHTGQRGITLLELTIALAVLALLLGSLLVPLASQVRQRDVAATQKALEAAQEALIGHALAFGRLPCPDNQTGTGRESRNAATGVCESYVGILPWAQLGVAQADAWGRRFKYRVTPAFTRAKDDPTAAQCAPGCTLDLAKTGDLTVQTRLPADKSLRPLALNVPAVILSFGGNGRGGATEAGSVLPAPAAPDADEVTNASAGTSAFVSRIGTDGGPGCSDTAPGSPFCEFDDQVAWVTPTILLSRMVMAGRLP